MWAAFLVEQTRYAAFLISQASELLGIPLSLCTCRGYGTAGKLFQLLPIDHPKNLRRYLPEDVDLNVYLDRMQVIRSRA